MEKLHVELTPVITLVESGSARKLSKTRTRRRPKAKMVTYYNRFLKNNHHQTQLNQMDHKSPQLIENKINHKN